MAARGLVNGRGPQSGRDLVFRCYPPELLLPPPKKKTEADLLGQPLDGYLLSVASLIAFPKAISVVPMIIRIVPAVIPIALMLLKN